MMKAENLVQEKSDAFAIRTAKLYGPRLLENIGDITSPPFTSISTNADELCRIFPKIITTTKEAS